MKSLILLFTIFILITLTATHTTHKKKSNPLLAQGFTNEIIKDGVNEQTDRAVRGNHHKRAAGVPPAAPAPFSFASQNPCGPTVLEYAVNFDNTMTSRRPSHNENVMVTLLNDRIGFYRTYYPRSEGHYLYNRQAGLTSMAYNMSQAAANTGEFVIPWADCYAKKIACDINTKQQSYIVDSENPKYFGTYYGFPNYCVKDFQIAGAFGTNDDEIQQYLYDNYQSTLLNLAYNVIAAGCAEVPNKAQFNTYSYYYCTFIFVYVVPAAPFKVLENSPCLCLSSEFNCCPTNLNTVYLHPDLKNNAGF